MSRWKHPILLNLALALGALGCGGGSASSGVAISIAATTGSVITKQTDQINSLVTGGGTDTAVNWTVTCASGVTAGTCGTIDSNGLYTSPATVPTTTSNGTTTAAPTVTITGAAHADTSKKATTTITIITGISIAISPAIATVGTQEHFDGFAATVSNPGCNQSVDNTCLAVTWSVPTATGNTNGTITDSGIDSNFVDHSVYTAPMKVPQPSTVTITATSVKDTTITATATVTIVTATVPTVTSVSPTNAGMGSLFQDVYITGTNFISTNNVSVTAGSQAPTSLTPANVTSALIRVRVPDNLLSAAGVLQFGVAQQNGAVQTCPATDPTKCQIVVASLRPAIVGPSPTSVSQQNPSGALDFHVNGGFFGTGTTTSVFSVAGTYDGQIRGLVTSTSNSARQLTFAIGGAGNPTDFGTAGLHPFVIRNINDPTKMAAANLAVQTDVNANPPTPIPGSPVTVGPTPLPGMTVNPAPTDVAVNPATGRAVVANTGTDDITVVDVGATSPAVIAHSICTASVTAGTGPNCPPSGPRSVAIDYVRNLALVANGTSNSIAVIDLANNFVTSVIPLQDSPDAVGVNPVTGRALVVMNSKTYGLLLDLTPATPTIVSAVTMKTGSNSHVAVEPHLNWAVATPGGTGAVRIVDLGRQTTNHITNVSRSSGVVTVTVQAGTSSEPLLAIQRDDAILIQGISDSSFNGVYTVTDVGPGNTQFKYAQPVDAAHPDATSLTGTASYAEPLTSVSLSQTIQGIDINPETQTAILSDPSSGNNFILSLLDQTPASFSLTPTPTGSAEVGTIAGAFNPLTNTAYIVNRIAKTLSVIDPTVPGPHRIPTLASTFPTGAAPVAVAVDPASDHLVVVNQGDNTISIYSLISSSGSVRPVAITETNPKTFVTNSTLSSGPEPSEIGLTIIGKGFSNSSVVRLDGTPLVPKFISDRELTAIVPPSLLMTARRFAVDVLDSGNVSNVSDFTVVQSVDVSSASTGCSAPQPSGVAIDPEQDLAVVSLFGCSEVAVMDLTSGTGRRVTVGANPLGVAVLPRLRVAIVANNGSNSASIVPELGQVLQCPNAIATGTGPVGVAADQDTGEAAVANSASNTVTILNVATCGASSISTGQHPTAVAFNYQNHQIAVTASASNVVDIGSASAGSLSATGGTFSVPTSIVYDPEHSDCGVSNTVGCFIANSSTANNVQTVDPSTSTARSFNVGINPTTIAYNYLTSTMITTNTTSRTVTVVDFLSGLIRGVLSLPPPPLGSDQSVAGGLALTGALQFAVDIHPLTNLAVIADTANGRVLLVPVPR